jgi:hypothetical protein
VAQYFFQEPNLASPTEILYLTIPKSQRRIKLPVTGRRKKVLTGLENLFIVSLEETMMGGKAEEGHDPRKEEEAGGMFRRFNKGLRDFIFGAALMEFTKVAREERTARQDLFLVLTLGELIGVPIVPSPYTLRLLPYVALSLESWKKRMVRKRDLTALGDL